MPTASPFRFTLQLNFSSAQALADAARKAEDSGMYALYVPDHPGTIAAPFAVLAVAATHTNTLRLGTNVLNCGLHHPIDVANAVATLDAISGGRVILGLGAGHTPSEWTARGLLHPNPADRVSRLEEFVPLVVDLLAGDTVTHQGPHFQLNQAAIRKPKSIQQPIALLIGGNGVRVLTLAGQHASIIGFSGLGRTKADGHTHEPRWMPHNTDASVALAEAASSERSNTPIREALVQHLEITDGRADRLETLATEFHTTPEQLDHAPYVLVGTEQHIVEQLHAHRERWGFTSYVVREPFLTTASRILAAMS